MNSIQADTIPTFGGGFSMGITGGISTSTINRDIFDVSKTQTLPNGADSTAAAAAAKLSNLRNKRPPVEKKKKTLTATKKSATSKHKKPATPPPPTASSASPTRKRVSKPRRVIPKAKTYIEESQPRDSDVVSGRGGRSNHHPGNKACWLEMLSRREAYKACETPEKKNEIAQGVVDFVRNQQGGRYVQLDTENGRWFILPDAVALEKAKQGLRDKFVPGWVTGEVVERKRSPTTKKPSSMPAKKRKVKGLYTTEPEAQPAAAVSREQIATPPLSSLLPVPSSSLDDPKSSGNPLSMSLSMNLSLSLDGLLSLKNSISHSFAGTANDVGSSEAVPPMGPATADRNICVDTSETTTTTTKTKTDSDFWGDMFQKKLEASTPV